MPQTRAGDRWHLLTLENPGSPVADGNGGFTQTYTWPGNVHTTATQLIQEAYGAVTGGGFNISNYNDMEVAALTQPLSAVSYL